MLPQLQLMPHRNLTQRLFALPRSLQLSLVVTPGQPYVFSGWTFVDVTNTFELRIGDSVADATYYYSGGLSATGSWQLHRVPFVPQGSSITIHVHELDWKPGVARSIWLDSFKLETGMLPTAYYTDDLTTRGTTIGPPLASAAKIIPTYQIHHVTGDAAIDTIVAPKGFAGELVLIPDGLWTTETSGNIKNKITATVDQPVRCIYDAAQAKWYLAP